MQNPANSSLIESEEDLSQPPNSRAEKQAYQVLVTYLSISLMLWAHIYTGGYGKGNQHPLPQISFLLDFTSSSAEQRTKSLGLNP